MMIHLFTVLQLDQDTYATVDAAVGSMATETRGWVLAMVPQSWSLAVWLLTALLLIALGGAILGLVRR